MRLIIFTGRPGTGKTTLARMLAPQIKATYLRIDTIEEGLRQSHLATPDIMDAGYKVAEELAKEAFQLGQPAVIADAVFGETFLRTPWSAIAAERGAVLTWVEVLCSDTTEHKARIDARQAAGHAHGSDWDEVQRRQYAPRPDPGLSIDTSGRSAESCIAALRKRL